jgi:hypothetical protein
MLPEKLWSGEREILPPIEDDESMKQRELAVESFKAKYRRTQSRTRTSSGSNLPEVLCASMIMSV